MRCPAWNAPAGGVAPNKATQGQALLIVTFSLVFLFAVMGFAIDLGWAFYLKARVQTAADAAATAAAVYAQAHGDSCGSVACGTTYTCDGTTPPTTSLQAGCLYVTTDGPPSLTATMLENNTTPPGVTGNSPSLWIRATVNTSAPNFFLFGQGFRTSTISAQATAGVTKIPNASCIYVLKSGNVSGTLQVTGSSSITTTGCGSYVNSSSSTAVQVTGSSHINGTLKVVGNVSITGSSTVSPAATTGTAAVTDPLATLAAPTFSGCDHTNYSIGNGNTASVGPGVYCGGITVGGAGTLNLSAGTYILNGGGLTVGNSGILNGSGVMFYNTATGSNTVGPISITGSGVANLSAPTSGTYQGVVFFQDRSLTYGTPNSISNSGSGNITGVYYFPTTEFDFTGNTNSATYAAFIANTIKITGSSTLQNDANGTYTGLTKTKSTLIQ